MNAHRFLRFAAVALVAEASPYTAVATEFVPGQMIIVFTSAAMPSENQVTYAPPSFGIPSLDDLLSGYDPYLIEKYIPSFNGEQLAAAVAKGDSRVIQAASRLERMFIIYYSGMANPEIVAAELSALACLDLAKGNEVLEELYGGTKQVLPSDLLSTQWNFHNDIADDRADIDAPEAWAIERGDSNTVIVVGLHPKSWTGRTFGFCDYFRLITRFA